MIRHRAFPLPGITLRPPDELSPGQHRTNTAAFGGGLRDVSNVPLAIRDTARRTSSQRQDIR